MPSSLIPLNVLVNERRLYLPLAAFCLAIGLVAGGATRAKGATKVPPALGGHAMLWMAAILILGISSWGRSSVWSNPMTLWTDAHRKAPGMPRVHFNLAEIHRRRGDVKLALSGYRKAEELFGGHAEVQLNLAALLQEQGNLPAAREILEPLAARHPDWAPALYNLGLVLKAFDPARATGLFARAYELRPGLPGAGVELGLAHERRGELKKARAVLESVVGRNPESLDAWVNLGVVCASGQDFDCAAQSWQEALKIDPGNSQARQNIDLLELKRDTE